MDHKTVLDLYYGEYCVDRKIPAKTWIIRNIINYDLYIVSS